MTTAGLLVPGAYQEDESTCNVCLAVKALDKAHGVKLRCLGELDLLVFTDRAETPAPAAATYRLLQDVRESFHAAQTEYAVAFAVSLTLYHTVERSDRHQDAREVLMAYQEYRARVTQAYAKMDNAFAKVFAHFQLKGWSDAIGSALATLHLAHQNTKLKEASFWTLTDKWTDDRYDKAFDFLEDLT